MVDVAAGHLHSLALKSDGTVWAWGINEEGQNGVPGGLTFYDGPYTTNYRNTPVQVEGLDSVVAIAAGSDHSLAIKSDGTVWAWGDNRYGELGDGSTTTRYTPVQVTNLGSVVAIAAGSVIVWRSKATEPSGRGEKIDMANSAMEARPAVLPPFRYPSSIRCPPSRRVLHRIVWRSKATETFGRWGYNGSGQLGDGTTTNRYTPVQVHENWQATPEAPQWPAGRRVDGYRCDL